MASTTPRRLLIKFLRRLDAPQSIAGSRDARQAPCRSSSSNTSGLIKPSCRSCWLVCDKTWIPQRNAIPNDKPSVLRASSTPLPATDTFILLTSPGAGVGPVARAPISRSSSASGLKSGDKGHTDSYSGCESALAHNHDQLHKISGTTQGLTP